MDDNRVLTMWYSTVRNGHRYWNYRQFFLSNEEEYNKNKEKLLALDWKEERGKDKV